MIGGIFLYLLARLLNVRITSWFRTKEYNRQVGGRSDSKHLWGGAIDIGLETDQKVLDVFRKLGFEVVEESTHYHIELSNKQVFFFRSL